MGYKILLVDDDAEFREEIIESLDDFDFIEASDTTEALETLKKPNEIDLVILDVMMPGKRGTQVLKEIKEISHDIRTIIITGYSSKEIAIEALKGHADEYVEKPVDVDKLRSMIENILRSNGEKLGSLGNKGKVDRVISFMEKNYDKMVSLEDGASLVFLSRKYLSRLFKHITGHGFNEYRLKIKMEKAKELLRKTEKNIDQISFDLGYQNPESFIRAFRKMTGYKPTDFRRKKMHAPSRRRDLAGKNRSNEYSFV